MTKIIGVLGAGQMGNGIVQVFAQKGFAVMLYDIAETQLQKGMKTIAKNLARQVEKGTLEESAVADILGRITTTQTFEDLAPCTIAIEAATENEPIKFDIFKKLDVLLGPQAIMASNTSSIPITRLGAVTSRPDKVIGMHFMNPVPVMKLVEVIRGMATSDKTFAEISELVATLGKEMALSADYPAFIVNRILMPMINEAVYALYEGVASAEDIDKGMKLGTNQPMGPLTLADFIGLDTCLAIMEVIHEGFKDSKYRPCPLLVKMVEAGYYGRKSGRGFYTYN